MTVLHLNFMRMNTYLSSMTKSEVVNLKDELNLTKSEDEIFNELSKGESIVEISLKNHISTATVSNRIKAIRRKIERVK